MEKCKTCANGYPSVVCTNCGTGFRNYISNKLIEIAKKGNLTDCGQRKCAEIIQAQQQEIDQLKGAIQEWIDGVCISQKHLSQIGKLEQQIDALTADKDEQAGRIMQMEDGLKRLRISFQWLYETIGSFSAYKEWAKEKIDAIDALLGGKEDGSSKDE